MFVEYEFVYSLLIAARIAENHFAFLDFFHRAATIRPVTDETLFSSYRSYFIRFMWPVKVPTIFSMYRNNYLALTRFTHDEQVDIKT